jgi:hypothetical protein
MDTPTPVANLDLIDPSLRPNYPRRVLIDPQVPPTPTSGITTTKPTNPKDAVGTTKLPLNAVPDTAAIYMALAFAEGQSKYGAFNWRIAGVRASIYIAAARRHIAKWMAGEERDPRTLVPHLASAMACLAIILDAKLVDKLTDDRPPASPNLPDLIDRSEETIKHLYNLHKDYSPYQYTIKDSQ